MDSYTLSLSKYSAFVFSSQYDDDMAQNHCMAFSPSTNKSKTILKATYD